MATRPIRVRLVRLLHEAPIIVRLLCSVLALPLLLAPAACSKSLPKPPASAHTADEFAEVPYPPPAVRTDKVPPPPSAAAVWLDGEWRWQGRRWIWVRGSWITMPPGATFARWDAKREGTTLLQAPGLLHMADGTTMSPDTLREGPRRRVQDVPCVAPAGAPAMSSAALTEPPELGPTGASAAFPPCAAEQP